MSAESPPTSAATSTSAAGTADCTAPTVVSAVPADQVHTLVNALARLSTVMVGDESLASLLLRISRITKEIVPGAVEVSVTLVDVGEPSTAAFTGQRALELDERQYATGHGPCLDAVQSAATLMIDDTTVDRRWPEFSRGARKQGVLSVLSIPLPLQHEFVGGLNIYGGQAGAFDSATVKLAETFAGYGAVAVVNTRRHAASATLAQQMREALVSRAVIEQAKGVIVASRRCTPDEAFEVLRKASQDGNRKLRDIAEALVRDASAPLHEKAAADVPVPRGRKPPHGARSQT